MSIIAATLACRLHAGQTDEHGAPHADHLTAVVTLLLERWPNAPEWAVEAAWLHDALRDTDATPASLIVAGISQAAVDLVQALSRLPEVPCADWISRLAASGGCWALRVKLAHNAYNSAEGYVLPELMARRHGPARTRLEAAERALCEMGT